MPKTRSTRRRNSSKSRGGRKRQAKRARKSAPQQRQPVPTSPVSNTRGLAQPPRNRAARILANIDGSKGEQKAWRRFLRAESPTIRRDARKFLKRLALLRQPHETKASKRAKDPTRLTPWIRTWNKLASRTLGLEIAAITINGGDITLQLLATASSQVSDLVQAMEDDKRVIRELFALCGRIASLAAARTGLREFQLHISGATFPPDLFADCAPITLQPTQESVPKTTTYSVASARNSAPIFDEVPQPLCPPTTAEAAQCEADGRDDARAVCQSDA